MIEFRFRPLTEWPRESTPAHDRKRQPFKIAGKYEAGGDGQRRWVGGKAMPLSRTYEDLRRELRHLGVDGEVVLEVGLRERDIRVTDSLPRSDAPKPRHPGVILSFDAKLGGRKVPLRYLCDDCEAWQDNLRAIALTLERLRLADLYGVTKRHEQYTGFAALPPAIVTPAAMTVDAAARFIAGEVAGRIDGSAVPADILASAAAFERCYRLAVKRHHPDAQPGNVATQDWQKLQEAAALLRKHHGL